MRAVTYVAGETVLHRCDARVKIAVLLAYSIGIFFVQSWWGMGAFALAVLALTLAARVPLRQMLHMLAPVCVLAAFSMLFNIAAAPGLGGLSTGLFFATRMIVLVGASFLVCLTTRSSELLGAFRAFLGPLGHVGVPVDDAAFTLSLSLRFIPEIERELATVRAAQKARGAELSGSAVNKVRIWGAAFSAVFVGLFRHADALADAMDSRCYGARRS